MRKKSAQSLPDVPSLQRWSPQQFRNALTKCLFDNENSFYSYINRLSGEVSQINLLQKQELTPAEQEIVRENIGMVTPVLDYELAINRPTIQGNELSGNMIDLYAQFRVDAAMPHVGEEEPNINLTKVWFDTTSDESQNEAQEEINTFAFRKTAPVEETTTNEELIVEQNNFYVENDKTNETMGNSESNYTVENDENNSDTLLYSDGVTNVYLVENDVEYQESNYVEPDSLY